MEYNIVQGMKQQIQKIQGVAFVGYYPYDYEFITLKMPCVLLKPSDSQIVSLGHHKYEVNASTEVICYRDNKSFEDASGMEQSIIDTITEYFHDNSTHCITQIGDYIVQTGDINQYIQPSQTGYNANIIVRKITVNYQFTKII